eukprot:TRINITY_DN95095_c0_g1_i1.p1 TRINITY_DN95095_c0_g1~~TRINITY_DN95095_c0_g1_i1.p1  ORF type:complete len:232 (-),score=80.09 TRINITY_DN95095_c0_g1_i1:101-796(-)
MWPRSRQALALAALAAILPVAADEVSHLKCAVCELAMKEASALVLELELDMKNEDDVVDFVDNLCTVAKREGRWLRRLDIQDAPDGKLKVENMTDYGECRKECFLVRKACQAVLGPKQEDIVELLRRKAELKELRSVCKPSCKKKLAPLKHRTDEEFVKGLDAGMLAMMENRDKMREETGQVFDIMRRDEMEAMSEGDQEAQAAQDAFAEELRAAREASGKDWKGRDRDDL